MIIDNKYKIEKAASTDETRLSLMDPRLDLQDKKGPVMVATDGKILAVIPVTVDEKDVAGMVPIEALLCGRKAGKVLGQTQLLLEKDTAKEAMTSATYRRSSDLSYPNWRQVIPNSARSEVKLSFDIRLLAKLANAIGVGAGTGKGKGDGGDGIITLHIAKDADGEIRGQDPVRVTAKAGGDAVGVLMPCRS